MAKIPEFPNEINVNPVVTIDLRMRDGAVLRLLMPDVQQARVMVAIGRLVADLDVPLDFELREEPGGAAATRPRKNRETTSAPSPRIEEGSSANPYERELP